MSKTYLVNLNKGEIDALTCDYLLKNCASKQHHDDLIFALGKMIKVRKQVDAQGVGSDDPSRAKTAPLSTLAKPNYEGSK